MNIFIPRCVAETSIPYLIEKLKHKFFNINKIFLITRKENYEIMKNVNYVDEVLIINTKTFNKYSQIEQDFSYSRNDIILIPVSNNNKIKSYNNVHNFMQNNFKKCKIYYYDFSKNLIFQYNKNKFDFIINLIVIFLTLILLVPLFILLLIIIFLSFLKRNNE